MQSAKSVAQKENHWFDRAGFRVTNDNVVVGCTYPIFGMITKLINDEPGSVIVELNNSIKAKMNIFDQTKVDILKTRAFESGIFVSQVVSISPQIEVECHTVIFGRPQTFNA